VKHGGMQLAQEGGIGFDLIAKVSIFPTQPSSAAPFWTVRDLVSRSSSAEEDSCFTNNVRPGLLRGGQILQDMKSVRVFQNMIALIQTTSTIQTASCRININH